MTKKKAETSNKQIESELVDIKKNDESQSSKIEDWLKIIGIFLAVVTLFFTYLEYKASEKWKVAEFTSDKFNEFSENKSVTLVNEMLDYNVRSFPLFNKDSLITVTDDLLYSSLVIDTINGQFTDVEVKIRDIFDEYFDQLSLFNRYAKAHLITYEEIRPYVEYQISIIADTTNPRKTNYLRKRIWQYINFYGFSDVLELYKSLGYDIYIKP